jgi:predicted Zn-dependent peptidase
MTPLTGDPPQIHRLANGVVAILDPAPGYQTLALSVVAGRGARWEDESQSGWSHLLEHMVFQGAGGRSARQIVEMIEADGGNINAATGHERTVFQVRALATGLPLALQMTADLIRRPTLDATELAKEKNVVLQEIAEAADTPDDQVFELAQAAAFQNQPLGRPILGAPQAIAAVDSEALSLWREALYAPDRLVVSVCGDIDSRDFVRRVEDALGDMAGPSPLPEPQTAGFTKGQAFERRGLEQAHHVFLLPTPGARDADFWALRLFVEILGGGMSSRLFQEARERLGLAYGVDAYCETYSDAGVLGIYAGCAPADSKQLAEVVAREVRKLAERTLPTELARAKAQCKAGLFMGQESLAARAEHAAAQWLIYGRVISPGEISKMIDAVSLEDLARIGRRILDPGLAASAALGPPAAQGAGKRFQTALFG